MRFEYYPDTDSLYIELNPHKERKPGGSTQVVGFVERDIAIDLDGDGTPVGIDIDSFASEIVDLSRLEAAGPVFGMVHAGDPPEKRVS